MGFSQISSSSSSSSSGSSFTKYSKTYSDFSDAGMTKTLTLLTLAQYEMIESVLVYVKTAFDGPAIISATIDLGDADNGDPTSIVGGMSGLSIAKRFANAGDNSGDLPATGNILDFAGTNVIQIKLTADIALNALTAGEVVVYVQKTTLTAP